MCLDRRGTPMQVMTPLRRLAIQTRKQKCAKKIVVAIYDGTLRGERIQRLTSRRSYAAGLKLDQEQIALIQVIQNRGSISSAG
jgi:hypothetical protein